MTPHIVIYGPRAGSSFRPHWMLAELGLAYEAKPVSLATGEHKSPEYLAINPAGQVPAMTYDGMALTESAAIVSFLADKHDPSLLGGTAEARATGLRWELFVLLNIDKALATFAREKWGMTVSAEEKAHAEEALGKHLPVLESWLANHEYLAGDKFTTADMVARASFMYAEVAERDLSAYAGITAWMGRCAERPAYAKAKQE